MLVALPCEVEPRGAASGLQPAEQQALRVAQSHRLHADASRATRAAEAVGFIEMRKVVCPRKGELAEDRRWQNNRSRQWRCQQRS